MGTTTSVESAVSGRDHDPIVAERLAVDRRHRNLGPIDVVLARDGWARHCAYGIGVGSAERVQPV